LIAEVWNTLLGLLRKRVVEIFLTHIIGNKFLQNNIL